MAKVCILYFDMNTGFFPSFHHGLAYLFGALRGAKHQVDFYHLRDDSELKQAQCVLKEKEFDLIGLSFTTNQKQYVRRFLESATPGKALLIAGGVHSSLVREQFFQDFPQIHGICVGEGDAAVLELCKRLDASGDYRSTPSFIFNTPGGIISNPVLPLLDIDSLPLPDYSLFDYQRVIHGTGGCFFMMLSRGCPYNCSYCCNHSLREIYPNKNMYVRLPSVERAMQIICNNLNLYPKVQSITFSDDTFTLKKQWLSDFCVRYKKEIGLQFICNARAETIDEEVMGCLKRAGCISINFGVESGNEWLRRQVLNRPHSNQKLKEVFATAQKHGIKTFSYNMVGLPFETSEMALDTLRLNLELWPNHGRCVFFFPFPGTRLYQLCEEYNLISENLEMVSGFVEDPVLREVFMRHKETRRHLESLQLFFYLRLVSSKAKLPAVLEKFLFKIANIARKPIFYVLNPNTANPLLKWFRGFLRKLAYKYLRA